MAGKTLVIADRKPFPPKKTPNMIFIDAVSGYRGLLSTVPETSDAVIIERKLVHPNIIRKDVLPYIQDVQTSQINRSYILKRPKHELVDYFLIYLPLWKGKIVSQHLNEGFVINANTGESEKHMAKLWKSNKLLHLN